MEILYPKRRNLLLSYPRSGNSFLRYCVEQCTGKSTLAFIRPEFLKEDNLETLIKKGMNKMDVKSMSNTTNPEVILEKTHEIFPGDELVFNKQSQGRLIVLLRDFKESIGRHVTGNTDRMNAEIPKYKAILDFYESYDGDKMVAYYESLILEPEVEIKKVLNFIGEYDEDKFINYINNFNEHKKTSVGLYENFNKSFTHGNYIPDFHAAQFARVELEHLNNSLQHPLTQRYYQND
jgi:hypothetical protein